MITHVMITYVIKKWKLFLLNFTLDFIYYMEYIHINVNNITGYLDKEMRFDSSTAPPL